MDLKQYWDDLPPKRRLPLFTMLIIGIEIFLEILFKATETDILDNSLVMPPAPMPTRFWTYFTHVFINTSFRATFWSIVGKLLSMGLFEIMEGPVNTIGIFVASTISTSILFRMEFPIIAFTSCGGPITAFIMALPLFILSVSVYTYLFRLHIVNSLNRFGFPPQNRYNFDSKTIKVLCCYWGLLLIGFNIYTLYEVNKFAYFTHIKFVDIVMFILMVYVAGFVISFFVLWVYPWNVDRLIFVILFCGVVLAVNFLLMSRSWK